MLFRVPGLAFLKPIIWPSKDHEPRIIGETPEYNFICYCARYYAVPKSLGPVDLDDEEQISNPLIIQSETEQDVRAAVEMYKSEATPTLVETKNEINIVRFMGFYYMIPCAAGKIDFAKAEDRNHPMIRKTQNKDEIDSILKDMLEPAM
jgi:hypothetical protein